MWWTEVGFVLAVGSLLAPLLLWPAWRARRAVERRS